MKDQKAENLLNLALSVPEEERRQTGELMWAMTGRPGPGS